MDKKNIKKHLTSTFLSEDKKPIGLSSTEKIQADSKKSNDANQKEVAKEMEGYEKSLEKETEPVKYENGEKEEEFQDLATYNQGSIINLKPDNDPGEAWVEKNKQAITGKKSTQGNSTEYANVIPEDQAGFTGPDFNDNLYKNNVKFNDKVEKSRKAQDARIGVNVNSDTNDNYLKENKKSKMKRLVFKKEFKGVGNALNLIPETYKVDGKEFHMTDGNEKYEIRWEGSLTEGRAIVLKASDKNLMNEDMENMKRLMGYKSQDTLGTVKGADRIDENKKFNDIWGKTKNLMTEMTGGYGFTGEGNLEGMDEGPFDNIADTKFGDFVNDKIGRPLKNFTNSFKKQFNKLSDKYLAGPNQPKFDDSDDRKLIEKLVDDDMRRFRDDEQTQIRIAKSAMSIVDNDAYDSELNGWDVARLISYAKNPEGMISLLGNENFNKMDEDEKALCKMAIERANQTDEGMTEDFPDLTGDGKVTQADILKGRGVELDEDEGKSYQHNGYTYYIDSETGEVTGGPEDKNNKYGFSIKDEGENTWRYEGYGEEVYKSVINNRPLTPSNDPSIENHPYVKTVLNHFFSELPNEELETSKTNLGLEVTDENGIVSISIEIDNGGGVKKYTCDNGKCRFNKD